MIVSNAQGPTPVRRPQFRGLWLGLAAGLLAATAGVHAAQPTTQAVPLLAQAGMPIAVDPAHRLPDAVNIANIDFRRGEGGSGKLILSFDGEGAVPDMRAQGSSVVVDIGNSALPSALQRPLNVSDFATPVQRVDAVQSGTGTRIVLTANGDFEPLAYQTGRDFVVEIVPRAAGPERAVGGTAVAAAGQSAASSVMEDGPRAYSGQAVTFNFQDIPVRTVLQMIAEESGLNIVASDSVQGNVTLRLIQVPWDQALDIVLQARSLDKRRNGNVVWVAPQSEIAAFEQAREDARLAIEDRAEMVTEYIAISYGNAEEIARLLTEESRGGGGSSGGQSSSRGFLSSRGSLSFDRRTNTLLAIDIPARLTEIKRLVQALDKPVDQVVIEARIVIADESFARDLGARFGVYGTDNFDRWITSGGIDSNHGAYDQYLDPDHEGGVTFRDALNFSRPVSSTMGAAGSLALTILGNYVNWDIEISALQLEGRGEVISNPRIVTSNQREALISQGQEVGYLTVTGGQSNNVPTVQFKDVLLELKVTPTITADGRVFLAMEIKKDEIAGFTDIDGYGRVPNLNTRTITTAVLVDDGQTVSIGGVYEFRNRNDLAKIPFLGDLPIIGNLFRNRSRSNEKAELLVFVTPKVLRVAQRS